VFGNATVSGNARIEDLAWVNSGGNVSGSAVVKNNAIVQGGVSIGGTAVVGGDAEPAGTCSSGTYLLFNPSRTCDGGGGEADVNPPHGIFTDAELAITGTTTPPTSAPPTTAAPTTTRPAPTTAAPTTSRPAPTTAAPTTSRPAPTTATPTTAAPGTRTCAAAYRIVGQWQGGFQGEVTVTASSAAISGWTVTWTFANGQAVTQFWGGRLTSSGAAVTAQPEAWNGSLAGGTSTTFGFIASSGTSNAVPALSCAAN
jgi:hypothetical protein